MYYPNILKDVSCKIESFLAAVGIERGSWVDCSTKCSDSSCKQIIGISPVLSLLNNSQHDNSIPAAAAVNVAGFKDSAGQLTGVAPAAVKADLK